MKQHQLSVQDDPSAPIQGRCDGRAGRGRRGWRRLLVGNGFLKQHQGMTVMPLVKRVSRPPEQWAGGRGCTVRGTGLGAQTGLALMDGVLPHERRE
jgi:hypothetical protein